MPAHSALRLTPPRTPGRAPKDPLHSALGAQGVGAQGTIQPDFCGLGQPPTPTPAADLVAGPPSMLWGRCAVQSGRLYFGLDRDVRIQTQVGSNTVFFTAPQQHEESR